MQKEQTYRTRFPALFFSFSLFFSLVEPHRRAWHLPLPSRLLPPMGSGLSFSCPLLLLSHLLFILLVPPDILRSFIRTRERMRCARSNNPFERDGRRAPLTQQSVAGFSEFLAARNAPWSPIGSRLLLDYWHFKRLMVESRIDVVVLSMNDDASTSCLRRLMLERFEIPVFWPLNFFTQIHSTLLHF